MKETIAFAFWYLVILLFAGIIGRVVWVMRRGINAAHQLRAEPPPAQEAQYHDPYWRGRDNAHRRGRCNSTRTSDDERLAEISGTIDKVFRCHIYEDLED